MSSDEPVDRPLVKRRSVKSIKSRLEDVEVGDVVNRQPDAEMGWFKVHEISTLFNGHLQLADETEQLTVSGTNMDMVGLQLLEEITLDVRGVVVPDTPPMVAMPAQQTAPPAATDLSNQDGPASSTDAALAELGFGIPVPTGEPDLEAEAAAAAAVATQMDGAPGAGSRIPAGVNLALVAELLEDLDVGEAPAITTSPEEAPVGTKPVLPPEAKPVYGDQLPETPSYKNPVVVPEGIQLPRRSRAAA